MIIFFLSFWIAIFTVGHIFLSTNIATLIIAISN